MNKLTISPFGIIRISPVPFALYKSMEVDVNIMYQDIVIRENEILFSSVGKKLIASISDLVGRSGDADERHTLLSLKRIISSGKYTTDKFPISSNVGLSKSPLINEYFSSMNNLNNQRKQLHQTLKIEIESKRHILYELSKLPEFTNGLLLSSKSLLDQVTYATINSDVQLKEKKRKKIEEGIIKYLARLFSKTSPFSTFTHVAEVKILRDDKVFQTSDDEKSIHIVRDINTSSISTLRLNNIIMKYLLEMLKKYKPFYETIFIRLNPTLYRKDNNFHYLFNSNNIDVFQTMSANPVLMMIFSILSVNDHEMKFSDMVEVLSNAGNLDASSHQIDVYLRQLIDYGLIEFNIRISGTDPQWEVSLANMLSSMNAIDPIIKDIKDTLLVLHSNTKTYVDLPLTQKQQMLEFSYSLIKAKCIKLAELTPLLDDVVLADLRNTLNTNSEEFNNDREADDTIQDVTANKHLNQNIESYIHRHNVTFSFKPEQLWYEDVRGTITCEIPEETIFPILSTIERLIGSLKVLSSCFDTIKTFSTHFLMMYKTDQIVPLVNYYQNYCASKLSNPIFSSIEKVGEVTAPNSTDHGRDTYRHWLSFLENKLQERLLLSKEVITIDSDLLNAINRNFFFDTEPGVEIHSRAALLHLYKDFDKDNIGSYIGVLSGLFPGYGKMFSRFLYIFNENILDAIKSENRSLQKDVVLVENKDASFFNANIHPPLLDYEVWTPNSHNSLPPKQQISILDIAVKYNENLKKVELIRLSTQQTLKVLDLGFLIDRGHSELFNLLCNISANKEDSIEILLNGITEIIKKFADKTDILKKTISSKLIPRIVFENNLVLQRRGWLINISSIPHKSKEQSLEEYMLYINRWRIDNEIPTECFVLILHQYLPQTVDTDVFDTLKIQADDRKPQHISFLNPFLVNLFSNLIEKGLDTIYLEEMLPDYSQLIHVNGEPHVTEFLFQWKDN